MAPLSGREIAEKGALLMEEKYLAAIHPQRDEHLDTIPEKESYKLIKSSVENLVPIPSESVLLPYMNVSEICQLVMILTTFLILLIDSNDEFSPLVETVTSDEDIRIPLMPSLILSILLNRDTLIDSSPKFDYLLEEFSVSPHLLSPVEDSDFLMEEIELFLASDDSMPSGIENNDYDSEEDICFLEELLSNDSPPLPENESSNLDHFNDPSSSRPPPEPPDVEICFDFKPDTGVVTNKVVEDISEHDVRMPNLLPTQPTLCPVFDLLLLFLSENEDKVFNPGILISSLLSHRGEIISNFSKSPMMISGGDIPYLRCFVSPLNPL
ncbi:hypothetical protein Tco_1133195 [Tanacetum coccineum]